MFHFPISGLAVCTKTAPVLPCSLSTLSFHLRVPHFSLLLLTCFHLCGATKRKENPGLYQRSIKDERRKESRRVFLLFLVCVFFWSSFFLCRVNSGSPESGAAGVSFRVDTGTLGTVSLLAGKTMLSEWPHGESFLFYCLCFYFENV